MDGLRFAETVEVSSFAAFTLGIIVYFIGAHLTRVFPILARYSIPEPVSGGLIVALASFALFIVTGTELTYDLRARDFLLVYFFTTIGLNARLSDLRKGGPILALTLALTVGFMILQNAVGMAGALMSGMPAQAGVLLGTAGLIGGHGTAIAWGPVVEERFGMAGAADLGIAAATLGLILASLIGGPIARFLIERHGLSATSVADELGPTAAVPEPGKMDGITHVDLMRSILWIHVAIAIGYMIFEALQAAGVLLPLFVPCMLSGILLSNTLPLLTRAKSPAGNPSLSLVSEFSLSVFLSMSLMSMELQTIAGNAGVLILTLALQALATIAFIILVVFRFLGRDYFAAVMSAGFAGFALGATPTAIANMTAVTQRYGPCQLAFIVLPLIAAFFVDLANTVLIQWTLWLGSGL
ncbi:sodium/glutamate symporter [Halovulum sp. GXIMD14794]